MADPDRDRLSEILTDWFERRDRGEVVDPEAVIRAHPEYSEELRARFEAFHMLDQALSEPQDLPGAPPRQLGEFRILREIGRGGMGVVYEAEQLSMGRRVALKVLSSSITSSLQAVKRFQREARAAGRLHHTNIVPIYAMGVHEGHWHYAMELVQGRALGQVIEEIKASRGEEADESSSTGTDPQLGSSSGDREYYTRIAEKLAGVADALELAHLEGIIHRDIKPSNLLLDADGTLKIVDFGLARLEGEGPSMTVTGALLGTPRYMSPEQAMAKRIKIDHRTDVYSLGATLYELLTLHPPFEGESFHEVCEQIITKDPALPRRANRHIPRDLETIVMKTMEKDRDKRYRTAGELAKDLRRFAVGATIHARRIGIAGRAWRRVKRQKVRTALVSSIVLLAAAGAFLGLRGSRESQKHHELEYARLCSMADAAVARAPGEDLEGWLRHTGEWRGVDEARELYTRAHRLLPTRFEALLGRALASGPELARGLEDLESARRQGLPERTYRLGRAHLFARQRDWEATERERLLALELPEGSAADSYFEAHLLEARGETAQAERILDRTIENAGPGSAVRYAARRLRARLRSALGDLDGALVDLAALRDMGQDSMLVRIRMASLWRRLGKEAIAERQVSEALDEARGDGSEKAWCDLCDACGITNEWPWLARISEEAIHAHPDSVRLLRGRAFALNETGEPLLALEVCERAEEVDPDSYLALETRGVILRRLGRFEEALAACRRAAEILPGNSVAHNSMGIVLKDLERYPEALEAFEKALENDPASATAMMNRGVVLARMGKSDEALQVYDQALRLNPTYAHVYVNRAALLHDGLGRSKEALEVLEQGLTLAPSHPHLLFNLGVVLRRLDRSEDALVALAKAMEFAPRDYKSHTWYWRLLAELGRAEEAKASAEAALERNPEGPLTFHLRFHALNELGRCEEALHAAEEGLRLRPTDIHLQLDRGLALFGLERDEDAARAFRTVLEKKPRHARALAGLGRALGRLGRHEEALDVLEQAAEIDPDEGDYHFYRGNRLYALNRFDEALVVFERALELNPHRAAAHMRIGCTLDKQGKHADAFPHFERAVAIDADLAHALNHLGMLLRGQGKLGKAIEMFDRAIAAEPENAQHHLCRGQTYAFRREFEEALSSYRRVAELIPDQPAGHYFSGLAYRDLGKIEEAIEAFGIAIEKKPDHLNARFYQGAMFNYLERYEEAVTAFDGVIALRPNHGGAHYQRSFALLEQGKFEAAIEGARKAVSLSPKYPWAHYQLARSLAAAKKHEEAIASFESASELNPGWALPHWQRGCVYSEMGRFEEEVKAYDDALKLAPEDPQLHNDRGTALQRLGRAEDAIGAFERALHFDPEYAPALKNLAEVYGELRRYVDAYRLWVQYVEVEPRDVAGLAGRAEALWHLARHEEALEGYAEVLRMDPSHHGSRVCHVSILMELKRYDEALRACDRFLSNAPDSWGIRRLRVGLLRALDRREEATRAAAEYVKEEPPPHAVLAFAYLCAAAGQGDRARKLLASDDWGDHPYMVTVVHAVLGDTGEAVRWFRRTVEEYRIFLPLNSALDPDLEPLMADESFRELVKRARTKR